MPAQKEEQSAGDFWANVLGVLVLVIVIVGFIVQNWVYFILPVALAIAGIAAYLHFSSNSYHVKTAWLKAKKEYDELHARYQVVTRCPPEKVAEVTRRILEKDGGDVSLRSYKWIIATVAEMYRRDYRGTAFPSYPSLEATRDGWHLAQVVEEARAVLDYAEKEVARVSLTMALVGDIVQAPWTFSPSQSDTAPFFVQKFEAVPDIRDMVTEMSACLFLSKYWDLGVGEWLRERYLSNVHDASLRSKSEAEIGSAGNVVPSEFVGTSQEVVEAYLGGTPFLELFTDAVPFRLSQNLRYEHGVIVAGTGGGKTQLLEALVLADLDEEDPPGVIVIDSKGEMVERIAHLALFHPDHGRLKDRLIIINHNDKPALNLFDVAPEAVEQRFNQIESLMKYFFGSLFDSKTSDQMDTLLIPLLHIVLRKEGATLRTLVELVRNPRAYPEMLDQIPSDCKDVILNDFKDSFYANTKSALITRLSRLAQDTSLGAMFTSPYNSVDLGKALNDGKIVLVNTDAEGLVDRSPTFGRYFIAQAYNAGLSRGSRQGQKRRPIHIYIDECAPYLDEKIEKMLTTIRSYGVGVMMAFQGQWQMAGYERVIQGNTSIKILGHLRDDADAKMFAGNMGTTVEFLKAQHKDPNEPPQYGDFGCFTTELRRTVSIRVPFYQLDKRKQMSESAYLRMTENNRERVTKGQPEDVLRATLAQHSSITGPLFGELEGAARAAVGREAEGRNMVDVIDLLTAQLSADQRRIFHILRMQRNRITHPDRVTNRLAPIPDLQRWLTDARALIATLTKDKPPGDAAGPWTDTL